MNGVEMLKQQVEGAAQVLGATLSGCTDEIINAQSPGTANSIAATVVHAVYTLDRMVTTGRQTIYESGGFATKLGFEMPPGQEYIAAVFAAAARTLEGMTDADLDREVDFVPGQKTTIGRMLGRIGVFHLGFHIGEVSALKGVRDLKGIPF
jgi:hypothetical protein